MKKNVYLALVDENFVLDEEVKAYFKDRNIEIIKYYNMLNMLKIETQNPFIVDDIKYIHHLELEKITTL